MTLTKERPALIVVDLQAITLGNARTTSPEDLLAAASGLIAAFRERGLPVIHAVSFGLPPGRTTYSETGRRWTSEQAAIVPEVAPVAGEPVVQRAAWSAFADTDLAERLETASVTTVVVVGLATPFGVESTARSAYDLGFSVVVAADAVAGPDREGHDWSLTRVIPALGRVLALGEVIAELA